MRHWILILWSFLLTNNNGFAQQPAYFRFAEQQFEGIDIFDVIEDNDFNYYFATDQGIYLHDGYTFKIIECPLMKGNSVFNFVVNEHGTIYCNNLNQQIFQIKDQKCTLIFTIPENSVDVNLLITKSNELIVNTSKNLFAFNSKNQLITRTDFQSGSEYLASSLFSDNSEITFHRSGRNEIILYSNGKFLKKTITFDNPEDPILSVFNSFNFQGKQFAIDLQKKQLYESNRSNEYKYLGKISWSDEEEHGRPYLANNKIWVASSISGVYIKRNINALKSKSENIFSDFFISDIYQDKEGNILLSTFDDGILVIPSDKISDVLSGFEPYAVTRLSFSENDKLYFGTREGQIGFIDKYQNVNVLVRSGNKFVETIKTTKEIPILFTDLFGVSVVDKKTGQLRSINNSSLKDVVIIDPTHFLLGTNIGVIPLRFDNNYNEYIFEKQITNSRVYQMTHEKSTNTIYVSSADGLITLQNGKSSHVKYKNKSLNSTYLISHGENTFISTRKQGLLIAHNGKVIDQIDFKFKGENIGILKINFYKNYVIANTENGLKIFDQQGKIKINIDRSKGLSSAKIIDFEIVGNYLFVTHSRGTQKLDLNKMDLEMFHPNIIIKQIYLNSKPIKLIQNQHFASEGGNIKIEFQTPTLKHRQNLHYQYKLVGSEKNWNLVNYENNNVNYLSLSSGNYLFAVRAEHNGVFSSIKYYRFVIDAPFYKRWWFIVALFGLIIGLITFLYWRKLKAERLKSEQINALNMSKLTAIQSQMNPHFIFNSLNSIQDLVLKGDVDNSYTFITKFSNLVRKTLNYSQQNFIEFDQEIKLLELYLSLEKLRFKTDFQYTINKGEIDDIMVPPMIIQPFVENALVHGLLHKEGEKRLTIDFKLEDTLICIVTDNGIGREKAKEIKMRQRQSYESFSGNAIKKRFEILDSNFKGKLGFVYEDVTENGETKGTKVTLYIPYKNRF